MPYDPKEGVCHAMDTIITSLWPEQYVKCALLEFRNDLITQKEYRENMVKIISPVLKELSEKI